MQAHRHRIVERDTVGQRIWQHRGGLAGGSEKSQRLLHGPRFGAQHGLEAEGRKAGNAAFAQLVLCEARIVVVDQRAIQGMVGILGLDQHFAGQFGAPAAAADLHQLREETLGRTKVGGEQGGIGADRADQGQQRKIMALGQHLGADQDVGLTGMDGGEQGLPFLRRARRIAVDAQDAGFGKAFDEHGFEALRTAPEGQQVDVAAIGAGARHARFEAAVVAAQAPVRQVQHEVGGATLAARDPAAGRTGQHRRIAAPVEEDQALLAALEAQLQAGQQRRGKSFLQFLAPRVDDAHHGHGLGHRALGQFQQAIAARRGVMESFQRRRGGAEHDRDVQLVRAPDRHIARRIAQAFLLLEGGVVLLVDHDQLQARQRHEHGEPGAEHDVGVTRERFEETARARRIGHAAVGADHMRGGEARRDAAFQLRREGDLGHQHQRLAATGEDGIDGTQIDLGLAATGDAVQQHDVEAGLVEDGRHGRLLCCQQLRQWPGRNHVCGVSVGDGIPCGRHRRYGSRLPGRRLDARLADARQFAAAQHRRQGEGRHFTERGLVVARAKFAERQPLGRQGRHVAQDGDNLF